MKVTWKVIEDPQGEFTLVLETGIHPGRVNHWRGTVNVEPGNRTVVPVMELTGVDGPGADPGEIPGRTTPRAMNITPPPGANPPPLLVIKEAMEQCVNRSLALEAERENDEPQARSELRQIAKQGVNQAWF